MRFLKTIKRKTKRPKAVALPVLLSAITSLLAITPSSAGVLDLNFIDPNNLGGAIPQNVADEAIKLFGIYTAHRSYSGANSIADSNGLDIRIEATMVKIGDGLIQALQDNGIPAPSFDAPAVPMAKVNLRKSLGDRLDLGFSGLAFRGQSIYGGDLNFVVVKPEEGPTWSFRLGYTYISIPYAYVDSLTVISPEIVASQRLSYAESYIGIGGRYMTGTMKMTIQVGTPPLALSQDLTKSGSAMTAYAFTGVYFRILGAQGLRLGMEGSYDISGFPTLGTVIGFGF